MTERARARALAIIPVRGRTAMPLLGGRPLIAYTIEAARRARTIERVVVSTDSEEIRRLAQEYGAEAPFLRPAELATGTATLEDVLRHCVRWLEEHEGYRPAIVVRLEISHPFRDDDLIDRVVETLVEQDLDTVFTAYEERHRFWRMTPSGELELLVEEHATRSGRRPLYREMGGLACASRGDVIRAGRGLGRRVGVAALTSLHALVDTEDEAGLELARRLL
jgi:CMP-N-acetylneuraminic acid synthetase